MTHPEELHVALKNFTKIHNRDMLNAALGDYQGVLFGLSRAIRF